MRTKWDVGPLPRVVGSTAIAALVATLLAVAGGCRGSEQANDAVAAPRRPAICEGARDVREIGFVSHRVGGVGQVFRLDVDRPAAVAQVTRVQGWATDAAFSPDGARVAFRRLLPGTGEVGLYLAHADGRDVRLLVPDGAMPSWSPDGRRIAFANLAPGQRGISIVDVEARLRGEASALRRVTRVDGNVPEELPAWSPDGRRIAFTSHRAGSSDIWVVDVSGANLRNLTQGWRSLEDDPSWSPDGRRIAFGSTRDSRVVGEGETGEIYVMNADGSARRRLTRTRRGGSYGPAYSPTGAWIAFSSDRDGNSEIYVMRSDGSAPRRLTRHPAADGRAVWVGSGC